MIDKTLTSEEWDRLYWGHLCSVGLPGRPDYFKNRKPPTIHIFAGDAGPYHVEKTEEISQRELRR